MRETVLIVGASCGWGHMQAARNIAKALQHTQSDLNVEVINIFDYLPRGLRFLYEDGWRVATCYLDPLYDRFYSRSVSRKGSREAVERMVKSAAQRVAESFSNHDVSLYIATHSMGASVGSVLKTDLHCKLFVVATDFVLHSLQVFPNVDCYYLPPGCHLSMQASSLENLRGRTWITGIPIDSEFAEKKDKEILRKRFGLSADLVTVLVSFGGAGLKADKHIRLFENLLNLGLPLQFIVLAGRNVGFAQAMLTRYGRSKHRDRIKVFGFLDEVSSFYGVADLFMGKAGGLTISEALASNLPIVIIDTLPGQENFNAQVISSRELGSHIRTSELAGWVKSFLMNKPSASWKSNIEAFARPDSSRQIATHIASHIAAFAK